MIRNAESIPMDLTHCGLVMPYDNIHLVQHWLSGWLAAPSHYLNQCWLGINEAHRHLAEVNFTETILDITHYKCLKITYLKNTATSPMGQWIDYHINGLVQNCSNSIANAMELLQSCTKPWMLYLSDLCGSKLGLILSPQDKWTHIVAQT